MAISMFLKHQFGYVRRIEQIGADCHSLSKQMQETYRDMHEAMLKQFGENVQRIMDSHAQQSSDIAGAIKGLTENNQRIEIALNRLITRVEAMNHTS